MLISPSIRSWVPLSIHLKIPSRVSSEVPSRIPIKLTVRISTKCENSLKNASKILRIFLREVLHEFLQEFLRKMFISKSTRGILRKHILTKNASLKTFKVFLAIRQTLFRKVYTRIHPKIPLQILPYLIPDISPNILGMLKYVPVCISRNNLVLELS